MEYTFVLLSQTLLVILSVFLLCYSISINVSPRYKYNIFGALLIVLYSLGSFFIFISENGESLFVAYKIKSLGTIFLAPVFLLFLKEYFEESIEIKAFIYNAFSIPIIIALYVFTFEWEKTPQNNEISYSEMKLLISNSRISYIYFAFTLILLSYVLIFSFTRFKKTRKGKHFSKVTDFFVKLTPFVIIFANLENKFDFQKSNYVLLIISALLLLVIFVTNKSCAKHIIPIVTEEVLDKMKDGILFLDLESNYLGSNKSAKKIFPVLLKTRITTNIGEIFDFPYKTVKDINEKPEFFINVGRAKKHFTASANIILHNKKQKGYFVSIKDTTEMYFLLSDLKRSATIDQLTGLYNREKYIEIIAEEFDVAKFWKTPTAILILDIDRFRKINDMYGYVCGDVILREIAKIIKNRFRETDIFARFGGEEISIFLSETKLLQALMLSKDLIKIISNENFYFEGRKINLTVSIGVASSDFEKEPNMTLEGFISYAELSLVESKKLGRNRIYAIQDKKKVNNFRKR